MPGEDQQAKSESGPQERELQEARHDVRVPWDAEWQKHSRDDIPPSPRPLPENPLLQLKPQPTQDGQQPPGDQATPGE